MATRPMDALDQESRIARAVHQAGDYVLTPHDGDTWICEGPRGAYLVSAEQCSCEDWQYRCGNVQMVCKHQWLLGRLLLELGGAPTPPEEGVCRRCGVVEPVAALVALDDLGTYACRGCYQGPEEPSPGRKPMTASEEAAFARIFG